MTAVCVCVCVKDNRGREEEHSEDKEGKERGGRERREDGEMEPGKGEERARGERGQSANPVAFPRHEQVSQVSMRVKRPQASTAAEFHFLFLLLQCEFLTILGAILRDGY